MAGVSHARLRATRANLHPKKNGVSWYCLKSIRCSMPSKDQKTLRKASLRSATAIYASAYCVAPKRLHCTPSFTPTRYITLHQTKNPPKVLANMSIPAQVCAQTLRMKQIPSTLAELQKLFSLLCATHAISPVLLSAVFAM